MRQMMILILVFALCDQSLMAIQGTKPNAAPRPALTQTEASHFASLAMKCIQKEYPNKLDHVNNDAADVRSPRVMHPSFYGCFDWHSTVHGHWMLVHRLRLCPDVPEARQSRKARDANL